MAFLSNGIDAVNVINARSHRRIRLREILLVLPQFTAARKGKNEREFCSISNILNSAAQNIKIFPQTRNGISRLADVLMDYESGKTK